MYAPEGLFQYLQMVVGFFNVPIFTIVFVGYISKRVPVIAAKIALTVFVNSHASMRFSNSLPSMRDDFEITVKEIDILVEVMKEVIGERWSVHDGRRLRWLYCYTCATSIGG